MEVLQHIDRLGGFDMPEIEVEIAYMRPKLDDVLLQAWLRQKSGCNAIEFSNRHSGLWEHVLPAEHMQTILQLEEDEKLSQVRNEIAAVIKSSRLGYSMWGWAMVE
eukprot:2769459-Amphidinium_carterae.1